MTRLGFAMDSLVWWLADRMDDVWRACSRRHDVGRHDARLTKWVTA